MAVPFHTYEQAKSWQAVLDNTSPEVALRILNEPKPTVLRTVPAQIEHHIEHLTGITPGTRARYERIASGELAGAFDGVLLSDLTADHVARWVNDASKRAAHKTVTNWHSVLSGALTSAAGAGLVPRNVAKGVRIGGADGGGVDEQVCLTHEEFGHLVSLIRAPYRPLVTLLGGTGIRWGEATALTIRDLNRPAREARIRQAWKQDEHGKVVLGPPKSKRSRRTVAVPDSVFDALEPGIGGRGGDEFAILNTRGLAVRSGSFHSRVWQPAVKVFAKETGRKPRIHDLRHSYASWMLGAGVPIHVVSRQLGHEKISTTVDTYGHLLRSDVDPLVTAASLALSRVARPQIDS